MVVRRWPLGARALRGLIRAALVKRLKVLGVFLKQSLLNKINGLVVNFGVIWQQKMREVAPLRRLRPA
jgi:hypothetical protein